MIQLSFRLIKMNLNLFKFIFTLTLVMLLSNVRLNAQNELDVLKNSWLQYNDASNSMYHFLAGEAYELLESRSVKIAQIKTKDELLKRQAELKKTMWEAVGPFPEKTPLNVKITGTFKKDGYHVENLIYESLPGFYVTASLFIPEKIRKPAPAILFCSGHSTGVYRLPNYQRPLLNLVKKGFVVLAIDPIGQGERLQYSDSEKGDLLLDNSTMEHSYPSTQVFLTGKSIARYFIWDGIRGIDYLVSRKEVDAKRIGVHGLSGGGTQTAFISALDERVAASAPACYITSYKRLIESVGVQDGEQNFYHGIENGIDHADFIEIRAPKPTLIMATTNDFFSIQGARETYAEAKRIYELSGKSDNIEIVEDIHHHGYTIKNREALYAFFQKHLHPEYSGPGSSIEEEPEFMPEIELQKTSTGQLSTTIGGESVFSLNRMDAEKLVNELQVSRNDFTKHLPGLINSAKKLSGYHEPAIPGPRDEAVFSGRIQREGYVVEKYFIKGEGDYVIPYLLLVPIKPNNKAVIYLHPTDKSTEAGVGGEMDWFVRNGFTVLAPDLIGTGEMGPGSFRGDTYFNDISYNMWYTSTLVGRSIVGIRAGDVVRLTRLLKESNGISEVYGLARKEMAPVLLHAAAFDQAITRIALIDPYSSYQSIAMNRFYNPAFVHNIVPGALKAYDLPDLAASLAPRKLIMVDVTDGLGNTTDIGSINKELSIIKTAYRSNNAEGQLTIISLKQNEKPNDFFMDWIK